MFYTMITHPFSEPQVDVVYECFRAEWLYTKEKHYKNNEYIWKVSQIG